MSNDTLTDIIARSIGANLAPVVKWLYATFAAVIVGTACVVGMVYDVRAGIAQARREAEEAKELATHLMTLVSKHEVRLAVHDAMPHPKP